MLKTRTRLMPSAPLWEILTSRPSMEREHSKAPGSFSHSFFASFSYFFLNIYFILVIRLCCPADVVYSVVLVSVFQIISKQQELSLLYRSHTSIMRDTRTDLNHLRYLAPGIQTNALVHKLPPPPTPPHPTPEVYPQTVNCLA